LFSRIITKLTESTRQKRSAGHSALPTVPAFPVPTTRVGVSRPDAAAHPPTPAGEACYERPRTAVNRRRRSRSPGVQGACLGSPRGQGYRRIARHMARDKPGSGHTSIGRILRWRYEATDWLTTARFWSFEAARERLSSDVRLSRELACARDQRVVATPGPPRQAARGLLRSLAGLADADYVARASRASPEAALLLRLASCLSATRPSDNHPVIDEGSGQAPAALHDWRLSLATLRSCDDSVAMDGRMETAQRCREAVHAVRRATLSRESPVATRAATRSGCEGRRTRSGSQLRGLLDHSLIQSPLG